MIVTYIIIGAILVILATWEKSPFRIYWKSESRRAFVRTGLGGAKAVVGRGALVVPLFHKIQWVDLGETKLVVLRKEKESVITKNLLRADMEVEFYVRVKAEKESVKQASMALGRRAENAEALRDFLEPNLLDALQAVASEMILEEIHQNRNLYSKKVNDLLTEELKLKGLELTAVSLCSLDQTSVEYYDPDNIFDSEGLLAIKEKTEKRKKERNDIEQEQILLIQQKNVEVRKRSLALEKDRAFAEQDNRKEIESQKEEREKELTQFRFQQRVQAEEARILHDQDLRNKEIDKERSIEEQRIAKERAVETAEIQKLQEIEEQRIVTEKAIQTVGIHREIALMAEKQKREETNIELEKAIETLQIAKDKYLENERIAKKMEVELAEIEKTKSQDVAELAKQEAVSCQEKAIALARVEEMKAKAQQEEAEQEVLTVKIRSQADRQKMAATLRAEEEAQVIERIAQANQKEGLARAEAERAMVEARNLISEHILKNERTGQLIGEMAKIAGELMKPAEKIDKINIVQVDGMMGRVPVEQRAEGGGEESLLSLGGAQSAIATIINGMLQIGAFKPVFKQLFGEDGIRELDYDRFVQMLKEIAPGLFEQAGKEIVKTSIRKEQERKGKLHVKGDKQV